MKNKQKKLSVTIGIPAYNEARNIGALLRALKKQETKTYRLNSVIVVSDGSTDDTVNEVKKVEWEKVKIIEHKQRLGLNPTQNKIVSQTKSDVLVLLDADILPQKNNFIQKLTEPFLKRKNVGIVGADTVSIKGISFVEKILSESHSLKKHIYKNINQGNSIYNCHGRARAFSKKYYSILKFPANCPEDSYSYLLCIKNKFEFVYAKNAAIVFRSPTNLEDQVKQSKRFYGGRRILAKYFDKEQIEKSFHIPVPIIINSLSVFLVKRPFFTTVYLFIVFYIRFINRIPSRHKTKYETSVSTKRLIMERS